jgi:membrane-associated protease RseP (regulator of RpoE activity)
MPVKKEEEKLRNKLNASSSIVVAVAALFAIIYLYFSGISPIISWPAAIIILFITGYIISSANGFMGFFGMYMLGSKRGTWIIDRLASRGKPYWEFMADWGLATGFGLLSYFMFKKRISARMAIFGAISAVLIMFFVVPFMADAFTFISIPQISSRLASAPASSSVDLLAYAIYAVNFIGGFTLFIIYSIVYNAASILYGIGTYLLSLSTAVPNAAALSSQVPGVAPLIPGITIPIFAGLLSLILILVVHEFSHGVLSKLSKIKIKSIGLVVFGIIPMGAFVEPDEKKVLKLKAHEQNRIFAAGISANILLSIIFTALLVIMLIYVLPHYVTSLVTVTAVLNGTPAYNVIAPGSIIYSWNGHTINNITSLEAAAAQDKAFSKVNVVTNKGSYSIIAASDGKIGVDLEQEGGPIPGNLPSQSIYFIYTFVALSAILNFLVGVVNLLPIPGFDGWRIFQTSIKNKKIVTAIALIVVIAILINILPWIWEA